MGKSGFKNTNKMSMISSILNNVNSLNQKHIKGPIDLNLWSKVHCGQGATYQLLTSKQR